MKKYHLNDEQKIRTDRVAHEWVDSGLVTQSQMDRILPELKVDLRRTNLFLRLILLGFGLLIILAAELLVGITLDIDGEAALGLFCVITAIGFFHIADVLVTKFRLYRFGIEEASVISGVILLSVAAAAFTDWLVLPGRGSAELPFFVGLVTAAAAAFGVYLRFGYLYAVIGSMACLSAAPFQLPIQPIASRLATAGLLLVVFFILRSVRRTADDEYPGTEYRLIEAAAWLGVYAFLNLHLESFDAAPASLYFRNASISRPLYWFTYTAIWVLPAIGLYLGLREKHRPLLDTNLLLVLVTLATNKPYWGAMRQPWDPILLGLLLIGIAVATRRWLSKADKGQRWGYTAERILSSDKEAMSVVGTASAAIPMTGPVHAHGTAHQDTFKPEGGRSGGAGASGSF
jgi:hypothetical protein